MKDAVSGEKVNPLTKESQRIGNIIYNNNELELEQLTFIQIIFWNVDYNEKASLSSSREGSGTISRNWS